MAPLLSIRSLEKRFPGVIALAGVDFELQRGEVHALMGENGAGKSTLIKVLTGVHARDGGIVELDGVSIKASSPRHAESLGISTVYQEVNLVPQLSVAENISLGRQPRRWGLISWRRLAQKADTALKQLGLSLDVRRPLSSYSIAIQQLVAIARAIDIDAKMLILDEPTSSLDQQEVELLFSVMNRLRDQGMGIVFVTHFLDQVYEISDRITVLRSGVNVGTAATGNMDRLGLIQRMLGAKWSADTVEGQTRPEKSLDDKLIVLQTRQLGRRGSIEPFDLQIREGEVIGLAGLLGSGRTELVRLLFGLNSASTGTLEVDGQPVSRWSPRKAIDAGFAFCPEDRKREGLVEQLTVRENILLAMQAARSVGSPVPLRRQLEISRTYVDQLNIKTPGVHTRTATLSGGNQQKVLLARWLATKPRLLILDEPTRGIDIGTKAEIEALICELSAAGLAVVLISSELEDLVRCCDRVVVLRDRHVVGEVTGDELNQRCMMEMLAHHDGT